jgi:hypothetical protein
MLHAEHLVFAHPSTDRPLDLRAPLPQDFKDCISSLWDINTKDAKTAKD